MIRILLADDHALVRTGLHSILRSSADMEVVGEVASGEDAVAFVRRKLPSVVLMEINMPGIGGIEATRKIRRCCEQTQVLGVTAHSEDPFPAQLMKAGASGYVSKGCTADQLKSAIRYVAQGRRYISSDVAQRLSLAKLTPQRAELPVKKLTQREFQVMTMILNGNSNSDISAALFLSPKTVSTYRHRIYDKLEVRNAIELARWAIRHGLLDS